MIKKKKILILGHRGFIGNHLCEKLKINNYLYRPNFYVRKNKIDLNDFYFKKIDKLIKRINFDYIVNLHAQTNINFSNLNYKYDFFHNCSLVQSIITSLAKNKSKTFFLNIGTVTQVGYTKIKKPILNNYRGTPNTIFDLHKQYNEDFISIYKKLFGLRATTLRLSNVYGTGKIFSQSGGVFTKIIKTGKIEKKIAIYGDGLYCRDFIYIDDVISGIILALKNSYKLKDDFYYLTSGKGINIKKFSEILKIQLKKQLDIELLIKKKKWPKNSSKISKRSFVGNPVKFRKLTNWKPNFDLKKGIKKILQEKNND